MSVARSEYRSSVGRKRLRRISRSRVPAREDSAHDREADSRPARDRHDRIPEKTIELGHADDDLSGGSSPLGQELEQPLRVPRSRRLVFVPEVRVDLDPSREQRTDLTGESREILIGVRRFAKAQVPKRRRAVALVHPDRVLGELDALPRLVPKVERGPKTATERAEREREEPLVARLGNEQPNRAEPLSEEADALLERRGLPELVGLHLDGEAEPGRCLFGPPPELILGRNPVPGRVELDAGQALRVVR